MQQAHKYYINIPETPQRRIVIVGGGFAGLTLARRLVRQDYQVVLIDKNNYHQFQPLFYQVAMAGLEPSSISFPFRKLFQGRRNIFIRVAEVTSVNLEERCLTTSIGGCNFDVLVLAVGADTNFFGNKKIEKLALPMKSVSEALFLRNTILADYEYALSVRDHDARQGLLDVVIVGGGPTGVELAGSLAEMRKYVLPKDYPELPVADEMDIYLIQSSAELLKGMSKASSDKALQYLQELGVKVLLNTRVTDYDGAHVFTQDGQKIQCNKVIWAAGIRGVSLRGLPESSYTYGNRLLVDRCNRVAGTEQVYAIGDLAYMEEPAFPQGHPQVAQVAMQQAKNLAHNFQRELKGQSWRPFVYNDKGSMATIGRARAVVDLPRTHFNGLFAWLVWLLVHLFSILGTRNKLFVFLNWVWGYLTYDQSLRLIIRPSSASSAEMVDPDIAHPTLEKTEGVE